MHKQPSEGGAGGTDAQVFERLQIAYGVTTIAALADAMRENISTVKGWKQRGSIPLDRLIRAAKDTNCSLDWLVMDRSEVETQSIDGAAKTSESRGGSAEAASAALRSRDRTSPSIDESLFTELFVAVSEALDAKELSLAPEKLIKLVLLIYEYEAAQRTASSATETNVQSTVDRFLRLVA